MTNYRCEYDSPLGVIILTASDKGLTSLTLPNYKYDIPTSEDDVITREPFETVIAQLDRYFAGEAIEFDVSLDLLGTDFQCTVWEALQTIPAGETLSYGELAQRIERPTASRAVGAANGQNPVSIIVPCHRVIGKNGTLTGYASGLEAKQWLLKHEQKMAADTFSLSPLTSAEPTA
ncbi:methylated-DNA--[protein]-cysteine S-methyltransferase [Enterovibrio baiacu]|uniref:methylated-DNA--[protein]-cysteine S-methyltransferase n=1 Tax=Enterovibrio baiacu TaxID=2491023 RepID=UPI00101144B9|nr:methylated-DNA--[protein]-cysteine S-methyltransferase [Enterovibrio baiacu]MBE1273468.1 methylated-DNA--[protein]-cysteine S-methyltransferase [Enterovibrio baiacu]